MLITTTFQAEPTLIIPPSHTFGLRNAVPSLPISRTAHIQIQQFTRLLVLIYFSSLNVQFQPAQFVASPIIKASTIGGYELL